MMRGGATAPGNSVPIRETDQANSPYLGLARERRDLPGPAIPAETPFSQELSGKARFARVRGGGRRPTRTRLHHPFP
jgi:hypothetical protein